MPGILLAGGLLTCRDAVGERGKWGGLGCVFGIRLTDDDIKKRSSEG